MIIKMQLVVNINPKSLTIFSHLISDPETLTVKFLSIVFSHCNCLKLIRVGLHAVYVEPVHESQTF